MSKIALWVILDDSVLVGVGDLANSWVMTGIAIELKGMKMASRTRLARRSVSEIGRVEGMVW
jgi:hypothetical protein